jgi:uncharacterized protein YlxP (DUF503 family)
VPAAKNKYNSARSVFINAPFDEDYKSIFRAIVFTVLVSGFLPRCALDNNDGTEIRVTKIAKLIGECDWGIHDLSRVEVDPENGAPRFNMPMELGIHLGAKQFGDARQKRKRALILETTAHRYDISISDISGQDIAAHNNDPTIAIQCVRNWLSDHRVHNAVPLPGANSMIDDYKIFESEVAAILRAHKLDSLNALTHTDFMFAVSDWIKLRV